MARRKEARKRDSRPRKSPTPGHVPAAEFKARCLELLDRVRQDRRPLVVTKHGKPVARVLPYEEEPAPIFGWLRDTVIEYGDIISPIGEPWEADEG